MLKTTYSENVLSYDGKISKKYVPRRDASAEISRDFWGKSSDAAGNAAGGHLENGCELATCRIAETPPREISDSNSTCFLKQHDSRSFVKFKQMFIRIVAKKYELDKESAKAKISTKCTNQQKKLCIFVEIMMLEGCRSAQVL